MKLEEALNKSGVSAIVYGESGIGKTYFSGTFSGKTLIIAAEKNGIKTLATSKNIKNLDVVFLPEPGKSIEVTADRYNQFFDNLMVQEIDADNIVFDSATELANQLLIYKTDPNKNGGVPTMKNYGEVQFSMKRYLRILRDLADVRGKNVIVIALETELVLSQNEDAQTSKTHPNLSGKKLAPEAEGLFDIVAHLEKKSDGTRFFRLEGNAIHVAKDRFGRKFCKADGDTLISGKVGNEEQTTTAPAQKKG